MQGVRLVRSVLVVYVLSAWSVPSQILADDFAFHHENVLGTSMELNVSTRHLRDARMAEVAILQEIDRLNELFNTYSATSEFSQFMRLPSGE